MRHPYPDDNSTLMALDRSRIRCLLFDVDGTLLDTDDLMVRRLTHWLIRLRLRPTEDSAAEAARQLVMRADGPGNRALQLMDRLHLDQVYAWINSKLYQAGWRRLPEDYLTIEGAPKALEELASHFRLGVVSARSATTLEAFLEHTHLRPLFETVVGGQTSRYGKPYPDPILHAAEELGVPAENCVMIGDTTVDMIAGVAAGAQTIGVLSGFGSKEELIAAGADIILPTVAHIPGLLEIQ